MRKDVIPTAQQMTRDSAGVMVTGTESEGAAAKPAVYGVTPTDRQTRPLFARADAGEVSLGGSAAGAGRRDSSLALAP